MEEHKKSDNNIPKNKSSMYSSNYKEGGAPEYSFEVDNKMRFNVDKQTNSCDKDCEKINVDDFTGFLNQIGPTKSVDIREESK